MATKRDFGNMLNPRAVKTGGSAWIGMRGKEVGKKKKKAMNEYGC